MYVCYFIENKEMQVKLNALNENLDMGQNVALPPSLQRHCLLCCRTPHHML